MGLVACPCRRPGAREPEEPHVVRALPPLLVGRGNAAGGSADADADAALRANMLRPCQKTSLGARGDGPHRARERHSMLTRELSQNVSQNKPTRAAEGAPDEVRDYGYISMMCRWSGIPPRCYEYCTGAHWKWCVRDIYSQKSLIHPTFMRWGQNASSQAQGVLFMAGAGSDNQLKRRFGRCHTHGHPARAPTPPRAYVRFIRVHRSGFAPWS